MESKSDNKQSTRSYKSVMYQAIGTVCGSFEPSKENPEMGMLVTESGLEIPARTDWRLLRQLKKKFPEYVTNPELLPKPALWTVYPNTNPLRFQLVNINTQHSPVSDSTEPKTDNEREVERFRLVGQIESVIDGNIAILIRRNQQPPRSKEEATEYQPFVLQVKGSLPTESVGQIWELEVQRQETTLVLVKGYFVRHSLGKPKLIEQKQKIDSRSTKAATDVLPPVRKAAKEQSSVQTPVQQEGATNPQPGDCATKSALPQTFAQETTSTASTRASKSITKGKMEVVVKVTEFPEDVKTVDKGWKEFTVDTGVAMVTISVKPKAFGLIEQAQQTCPSWIAAISGQMSEQTATGFRLESLAVQVFERKTKNSSQGEADKIDNNFQPSTATSSDPFSISQKMTQQQAVSQPKRQSQLERSQSISKEKQSFSTAQTIPVSKQPSFSVKVNERVFLGHNSVTLNKRVLTIDGKPVAQGKLAIVEGKPCTMNADGSVTHGNNQTVLMSK